MQTKLRKGMLCSLMVILASTWNITDADAEVVVVVSAKNIVVGLTRTEVARIFLGKTSSFPNGENATPVDQAENNSIHSEFYTKVTGKSAAQLKAYWAKIIFAGDGQPPKAVSNSEGVRKAIATDVHAIGYLDRSAVDDSLKIVLTP